MPRPQGSKNKVKTMIVSTTEFAALIAQKTEVKENLTTEIANLEKNLNSLKADLQAKKAELKKLDTELPILRCTKKKPMLRNCHEII